MGIRKINLDEVFPPKPPKTKSKAVYVDNEPEPVKVTESKPRNWRAKLIQERLKNANVGDIIYFPEFAVEEITRNRTQTKPRTIVKKERENIRAIIPYSANLLGLKVSVYWVRVRKSQVIPRVTVTAKKSEGS
jgi:hypothetical protein